MRRTGRTLRKRKGFRCKFRDTRTWVSFFHGRGWHGGFIASSCTASAELERCWSTRAAARGPGDLHCGWDPAPRLFFFSLSKLARDSGGGYPREAVKIGRASCRERV